jgi:hypothetical protein
MMEAVCTSETSVYSETTRRYISERCHLQNHCVTVLYRQDSLETRFQFQDTKFHRILIGKRLANGPLKPRAEDDTGTAHS